MEATERHVEERGRNRSEEEEEEPASDSPRAAVTPEEEWRRQRLSLAADHGRGV